jgi:hypothetical protein
MRRSYEHEIDRFFLPQNISLTSRFLARAKLKTTEEGRGTPRPSSLSPNDYHYREERDSKVHSQ